VFGGNGIMGYSESYNYTGETVIIGRVGEYCGITRYVDEPCWITDNALYAKEIAEGVKPIYLAYKLQQLNLSRYRSKGGQPLISQTMINPISLPLPPLSEQKRIAEVLSTWDQAIQLTEQLIRQKEQRKKWLMQNLLTGKMRLKGFSGESQFRVLGKFITEVSDRNKNGEIKNVLSVTNSKGFINQAEQFEREVASADVSNYKIVRKGQFAYNPSRVNVGSLDLLRKFDIGILSPMYVVFETDQKNLIPEYLFYLLKTNWFYGHIPMFVQGSVRDSLSFDGLCGMKFFIPSIEEQTAIAEVLQTAEKEIELRKAKAEKLKEQKKGLMQQLLTGRVRLKINNE
jgi:type I restriction enzyme S subunit